MSIIAKSFAVPSTVFLKETKEKTSVLIQQKSRRLSTAGAKALIKECVANSFA